MGLQRPLRSSCAPSPARSFPGGMGPLPGEGLGREPWGAGLGGGAEVFHHAANVWCQQGTTQKAHSIQCLLLSKPSSVARTACPESTGHRSRASPPAEGSACQVSEAGDPPRGCLRPCRQLAAGSPRAPAVVAWTRPCFPRDSPAASPLLLLPGYICVAASPLLSPHGVRGPGGAWAPQSHQLGAAWGRAGLGTLVARGRL